MDSITTTNTISLNCDIEISNKVLSLHAKHFTRHHECPPQQNMNNNNKYELISKRYLAFGRNDVKKKKKKKSHAHHFRIILTYILKIDSFLTEKKKHEQSKINSKNSRHIQFFFCMIFFLLEFFFAWNFFSASVVVSGKHKPRASNDQNQENTHFINKSFASLESSI